MSGSGSQIQWFDSRPGRNLRKRSQGAARERRGQKDVGIVTLDAGPNARKEGYRCLPDSAVLP